MFGWTICEWIVGLSAVLLTVTTAVVIVMIIWPEYLEDLVERWFNE